MVGLLRENGPCYVKVDSNSTMISEWAWNNEGMLLSLPHVARRIHRNNGLIYKTREGVEDRQAELEQDKLDSH